MAFYTAPGVYVTEIPSSPHSIDEVSTAIPAFVGYTQSGPAATEAPKVVRINSISQYESVFGGPQLSHYTVNAHLNPASGKWSADLAETTQEAEFHFYYCLYLFFQNGGGSCFIVSIGNQSDFPAEKSRFSAGLSALEKEDEPTLIVFPEAANLLPAIDFYTLCQESLTQCSNLEDRFSIFDIPGGAETSSENIIEFRNGIGTSALQFGAAYHPYLQTAMSFRYNESDVIVKLSASTDSSLDSDRTRNTSGDQSAASRAPLTLSDIKASHSDLYQVIKNTLSDRRIALPPSSAVAGCYARVDLQRGVWKAPANVSLNGVVGPSITITDEEQAGLNVNPVAGKSINAIRVFAGKGTLIWGGRTLDGNSNEWRYISIRRLSSVIIESTKKSTAFTVFEPNNATTWDKVKIMIEAYLSELWRQGALEGAKREEAFFVKVGLGETMTAIDLLEGRMKVEIGIAPVRPAEFIILRVSHTLYSAASAPPSQAGLENSIAPINTPELPLKPAAFQTLPLRRIQTSLGWESLALDPAIQRQIDDIKHWIEHSATLKNDWGMADKFRAGYRCLFHGASGTGKTLAACLLGKTTGHEVYQLDLAMIVSKYIGETEKNLSALFDRVQGQQTILFFDEADALFGRRGEISVAESRYANQEVSYLLQRTERFGGVCIFASHFNQAMDRALLRRFESVVYFPMPGTRQRLMLWKQAIPTKVTLEDSVDLELIASKYELTGNAILSAVRYAAVQALARGDSVLLFDDIHAGIHREVEKNI